MKKSRRIMSLQARQELLKATAPRYQKASKKEKQRILDEFIEATQYHRKYANRILFSYVENSQQGEGTPRKRHRYYDDSVKVALTKIWEATNRICSKRLVPFIPEILPKLQRFGHLEISADCEQKLLEISPATVDRLLSKTRHKYRRGKSTTKPGALLKNQIPIRIYNEWDEQEPGFIEADLVAHCGTSVSGSFLCTLTMTDVATGWTECFGILYRDSENVIRCIDRAKNRFPFLIKGIDTDNGSEFITYALLEYCTQKKITFTRCRPYKKNDQCFVEQKNGAIVRHFIGYDRFEGVEAHKKLENVYDVLNDYINFFQPSVKLIERKREGKKIIKKYDKAKTPYQRLLESKIPVPKEMASVYENLDPVDLLGKIRVMQKALWAKSLDENVRIELDPTAIGNPDEITVETLPEREVYKRTKPVHGNTKYKRWWRTRNDPFVEVWDIIVVKLSLDPDLTGRELLIWLQESYPNQFQDGQLRTLQRRVREWRISRVQQYENDLPIWRLESPENLLELTPEAIMLK